MSETISKSSSRRVEMFSVLKEACASSMAFHQALVSSAFKKQTRAFTPASVIVILNDHSFCNPVPRLPSLGNATI